MSIKLIHADVEKLVDKELELADGKFPPFNSRHEGYAVIREEWKEHGREAQEMNELLSCLEDDVFMNAPTEHSLNSLEMTAINAACEAIQVAAMCRKFRKVADK